MSTTYRLTRPPAVLISPVIFSPAAASRSKIPTAQPSSASRRAMAAPMPLAPPVTMTARSFNPRMSAPCSRPLHFTLLGRATCQHAGGFVGHDDLAVLVLHVDLGNDNAAIALRCGADRCHLDLAVDGV